MKVLIAVLTAILLSAGTTYSQVEFSKFKFIKDSPFGMAPGRKATDVKFTVSGERTLKYVKIHYYGVNQVNDAVSSDIVGAVNANAEHTKFYMVYFTGPFEPGKTYSQWASGTFWYKMKVTAFPFCVELTYMDGEVEKIEITKGNLNKFFPKLKWIDVNVIDGI